jgi:hypothetical protein
MKLNENTIYVLQNKHGNIRILVDKTGDAWYVTNLAIVYKANLETKNNLKYLLKYGYEIIQEWK